MRAVLLPLLLQQHGGRPVARYFFTLSEGNCTIADDLGAVCRDDQTAVALSLKLLANSVGDPSRILPWQFAEVEVKREDGVIVGRVGMTTEVETLNPATAAALYDQHASADCAPQILPG